LAIRGLGIIFCHLKIEGLILHVWCIKRQIGKMLLELAVQALSKVVLPYKDIIGYKYRKKRDGLLFSQNYPEFLQ